MSALESLELTVPSDLPSTLPVIPLRRGVLLPGGMFTFSVGRPRSVAAVEQAMAAEGSAQGWVLLAVQREPVATPAPADLLPVAVLARITDGPTKPGHKGPALYVATGVRRAWLRGFPATHPCLEAAFQVEPSTWPDSIEAEATWLAFKESLLSSAESIGGEARVRGLLAAASAAGAQDAARDRVLDLVAGGLEGPQPWTIEILQTADPLVRAEKVIAGIVRVRELKAAREAIEDRLKEDAQKLHKEVLLRRQMEAIKGELGESDDDELDRIKEKLADAGMPEEVQAVVDRELARLERMGRQSPERSVAVDWLERIADMPWSVTSATTTPDGDERVDIDSLEAALDKSHHGLSEVKRQVVEHLSVRMLAGKGRADVLLLVGPPGVGKTSIGQAIADAMGKKLVRVALGGVRDEAELRGHRRTYIGARPGRIVEGVRRAGVNDPVMLLDEIDKLVQGWQGNPSAALLEILDPEQNHHFVDHYLEVPWDLSRTLFIATANDLSAIPGPLRDRMEVLHIEGYSAADKAVIARHHLLTTLAENAGVAPDAVQLTDAAIAAVISGWTREAGVRQLQRALGRIYRAAAVRTLRGELDGPLVIDEDDLAPILGRRKFHQDEHEEQIRPGIATGLAWTPVGGDVLYVEASTLPGKGQLMLTGQLGDVMKESARAALTYVLSHATALGIPEDVVRDKDVHLHVPAGAVPKDGPSAGVTMFTAIASLLSGRNVRPDVAMTGEATLRGRVLPVGGIKSKVLAAHRLGIRTVILPRRNGHDVEDIPAQVRDEMEFVLVDHMDEVLAAALESRPDDGDVVRRGGLSHAPLAK
ncbi:MAG: endopeptidase La [Alphaproteobacteria bacterium]|nr:endopeptidase La [Alphaproteobacteria bacterium]